MIPYRLYILFLISAAFIASCSDNSVKVDIVPNELIPAYSEFPAIKVPQTNKLSSAKIELGQVLFYEKLLSKDTTVACASCHKQDEAFASKGNAVNPSVGGQANFRNVPPVFNIGYYDFYFWDGRSNSLEQMFHDDLSALTIFDNDTSRIVNSLVSYQNYRKLFNSAYGSDEVTVDKITMALASFVRSIVSGDSRYDKYIRGDKTALTESEIRGMNLFFGEKTNCNTCHTAPLFTDQKFHSTGINTHYFDFGRFYITEQNSDRGKFRTPSIRNVLLTAPYMHNGEIKTIEELIDHYNRGGKLFINKSELIRPLNLTIQEKSDLIAFLSALTDLNLISSTKYGIKK